jgi:hypothetical protein
LNVPVYGAPGCESGIGAVLQLLLTIMSPSP